MYRERELKLTPIYLRSLVTEPSRLLSHAGLQFPDFYGLIAAGRSFPAWPGFPINAALPSALALAHLPQFP